MVGPLIAHLTFKNANRAANLTPFADFPYQRVKTFAYHAKDYTQFTFSPLSHQNGDSAGITRKEMPSAQ